MIRYDSFRRAMGTLPVSIADGAAGSAPRRALPRAARGFTMVELMVTLVVAGILIMIAIPSFSRITLKHRLNTVANEFVNSLNTARMAAIKRNSYAQFCGSTTTTNGTDTLGSKCGTASGAVYLLSTAASASTVTAPVTDVTTPLQYASTGVAAVRFNGQGMGNDVSGKLLTGTVVDICTTQLSTDNHRVIAITNGTIITTTTSTSSTCP